MNKTFWVIFLSIYVVTLLYEYKKMKRASNKEKGIFYAFSLLCLFFITAALFGIKVYMPMQFFVDYISPITRSLANRYLDPIIK
ncbi:hypothetical protein ADA01nite_15240 [Aneurinibacillus danicus]|jgi:hypothetical protein|uniref:Uncharacterized protein n=1 Tax=Aneurinibacillus danicus TaxID=267746 RepID=A0A511V563_9BACL|nr:hypothetical protein ADA01nite_15240 [Aneurinibacillus danicus]